ncbi:hypothetical protein, partial [Bradyrhizobium sp. BR 1432]|uniref:hypothetical protein n=1 Tax=Bradyrhizobium sp. BR 1432 TaxID=3447966 RepID=UPI003EE5C71C
TALAIDLQSQLSHRAPRRFYAATFLPTLPRAEFSAKMGATKSPRKRSALKGLKLGCGARFEVRQEKLMMSSG